MAPDKANAAMIPATRTSGSLLSVVKTPAAAASTARLPMASLREQIEAVRKLLQLAEHPDTPCEDADLLTTSHLAEVERKIEELGRLRDALLHLAGCCAKTVADCRIIDALAWEG